jgi:hypothetical protein
MIDRLEAPFDRLAGAFPIIRLAFGQANAWTVGPVIQLGLFYVGVQAAIRFGKDPAGEALLLFHVFPAAW